MKLIYSGFDKLEISFQGALSPEALEVLRSAKEEAKKRQSQVLVQIGPGKVEMHVADHGLKGGYAFVTDTGPTGEKWTFKDNPASSQWNIAVSVHASSLAVHSLESTWDRLTWRLLDMGATVLAESVRRVDYAMDFLTSGFEINLDLIVAHGHCKVQPYWGEKQEGQSIEGLTSVFRGRRIETVTVGKMPGRQVTIYDKRKAAIEQRKLYWFAVWKMDRHDRSNQVWRVELRAGKKELKGKWRITTFADVKNSIGDVFRHAASQVRYVDEVQTDTNISRQRLHPLWLAVMEHLEESLLEFRSGLLPGQLKEIERQLAIDTYAALIIGNSAGLAVASQLDEEDVETELADLVAAMVHGAVTDPDGAFGKKLARTKERLRFVVRD